MLDSARPSIVGLAPSVAKAMELLATAPKVDAAVLDINLGEKKSFPTAAALEANGTPFVFATAYNSADVPSEWQHVLRVIKPVRALNLAEALLTAIASANWRSKPGHFDPEK